MLCNNHCLHSSPEDHSAILADKFLIKRFGKIKKIGQTLHSPEVKLLKPRCMRYFCTIAHAIATTTDNIINNSNDNNNDDSTDNLPLSKNTIFFSQQQRRGCRQRSPREFLQSVDECRHSRQSRRSRQSRQSRQRHRRRHRQTDVVTNK